MAVSCFDIMPIVMLLYLLTIVPTNTNGLDPYADNEFQTHSNSRKEEYQMWIRDKIFRANMILRNADIDGNSGQGSPSRASEAGSPQLKYQLNDNIFNPGEAAGDFMLPTLGGTMKYPGSVLTQKTPILFHAYTPQSAFLQCLWNCSGSLESFVRHAPNSTHYVFMSNQEDALHDALWMRQRFLDVFQQILNTNKSRDALFGGLMQRVHFVTVPVHKLANWLPKVLHEWMCTDHNCGIDQAVFFTQGRRAVVVGRLDARYDWLPAFPMNRSFPIVYLHDGCTSTRTTNGKIALVNDAGCSYFKKLSVMKAAGAVGVIIEQGVSRCPLDMNCDTPQQCAASLNIPLTMIMPLHDINRSTLTEVTFQNIKSDNFFMAIDSSGRLAEVGWFLYPSFQFFAWQAQWFDYAAALKVRLVEKAIVVPVFNRTAMHGSGGAIATVTIPPLVFLQKWSQFELDTSMQCPGKRDTTCPHWDHTVQLYVCCNQNSPLCGMELGRWITPFRRQIGRWLTDVTPLFTLLDGPVCTFTMKTAPWAMTWMPSLNLRFTGVSANGAPRPYAVLPLYNPGATFDRNYNSHFGTFTFKVPLNATRAEIVAVITGHGSDENGCGEFCVTSHHFAVNDAPLFNKTFNIAGTPLGCASRVAQGVEPNEHGTWLYGRDGWCDGQQVSPWLIDVTTYLNHSKVNRLRYFGLYRGKDPNPKHNPGEMILFSYLVFYKQSENVVGVGTPQGISVH